MTSPWLAKRLLKQAGWTARLDVPLPERCVIVAEPHTSNWDGWYLVLGSLVLGLDLRWMIKAEANRAPWGKFLSATGALYVERGKGGSVEAAAAAFDGQTRMRVAIAPSGTRKRTDHWRTGFLRIARLAKVPIALGYVDYERREVGIGLCLDANLPDEELQATMAAFYATKTACRPEWASDVHFGKREKGS